MYFQELYSVELLHAIFSICQFCIVGIVISRKGECSEGLGTSFITDMRSVGPDRTRGCCSAMFLLSRTKFVMSVH